MGSIGWLVQGVGAAWLMTTLAGTADMVALVQSATMAPILLFALLAGALADLWDRRWVLMLAQLWVAAASFGLAAVGAAGLLTPASLLLFTFLVGTGAALNGPAWQAVVRELVPPGELAAAVTLNAIGFNLARALGPAVGGASSRPSAPRPRSCSTASPPWRWSPCSCSGAGAAQGRAAARAAGSAVVTGLRYVGETPAIRAILVRSAVFGIAASAALALLPLIARDRLGGGPVVYGLLLGAFGVGALLGAFLIHPLRQRRGAEFVVTALSAAGGARVPRDRAGARLVRARGAGPGGGRDAPGSAPSRPSTSRSRCARRSGSRRACSRSTRRWCSAAWRWGPGPGARSPT